MSIAVTMRPDLSSSRSGGELDRRKDPPRETYWTPDTLAIAISRVFDSPITTKTLANWRSAGKGPEFVKMGRRVRYDLRAVNRWFEAQRRNGAAII